MSEQLENLRIDQLPQNAVLKGSYYFPIRNMDTQLTERVAMSEVLTSGSTQNFEWITDNDPGYAEDEVVTYGGKWWQSLIDNNLNIVPGTDPTKWAEVNKSPSGFVFWQAGVFPQDEVFVLYPETGDIQIYHLVNATRPYNSTDFETELAAGDWEIISGGGGGGGIAVTGSAVWLFSDTVASAPGTGLIRFDSATIGSITNIYINETTNDGEAVANFLATLKEGDAFYIQEKDDATRWLRANVTGVPVDNGTWWTIPVEVIGHGGLLMNDAAATVVRITAGGGTTANASETVKGIVEEADDSEITAGTGAGATGARLFVNPAKLATRLTPATQAEMITGTDNVKPATAKSVEDKRTVKSQSISNAASGSINHDCGGRQEVKFVYANTVTGAITITRSNDSNLEVMSILMPITGSSIAITFPSDVRMARHNEVSSGSGWYQSTKILIVSSVAAGDLHEFSLQRFGSVFILRYDGPARP